MAETSTETLRRLLDERGVKYRDYFHADKTWWSGRENVGWYAENRPSANGLYVMIEAVLTPAQAIAATLGPTVTGETSDGYHTFNELYHHRAVLFSVIVRDHAELAWKSKAHHDGSMYDGMFIVGIQTPQGQATYHYDIDPYWEMFDCRELERAPEWDGHTPEQAIKRIATLGAETSNVAESAELREQNADLRVELADMFSWLVDYITPTQAQMWADRMERLGVEPTWGWRG